jgi:peptide/nickel transport system substrate-binding protein
MKTAAWRHSRRVMGTAAVAVGLALTAPVVTLGGSAAAASKTASGGVLTVGTDVLSGSTVGPIEFDPAKFTVALGSFSYDWPIYGGLLRQVTDGSYVPDLASQVTVPDASTIDVQVRPGVVFSDGTVLDAAAVKAGLERNLATTNKGAFNVTFFDISSIDVTGTDSVVIHFSQPVANLFYPHLADEESFIVSPKGAAAGTLESKPVGAGPFMLKSFTPSQKIELVKNPKYWDAKSIKLSGITFVETPSGPQQINSLATGLVNAEESFPINDIPALKKMSSVYTTSAFLDANYLFAPMCKSSGPLANVKVRQALSYAINRPQINAALLFGKGEPAWSFFPSSSVYYNKALTNSYRFDLKKAKQLLVQAGYPHGFSTSITPLPMPLTDQLATILQAEWKKIGVNLQIVQTTNYVNDFYIRHTAQIGLNPSGSPGVAKVTGPYVPGSIGDACSYNDPQLTTLATEASSLPASSPQLKTLWNQMQSVVMKNALSFYVAYTPVISAATKNVKNLQVIPYIGGILDYWNISVTK